MKKITILLTILPVLFLGLVSCKKTPTDTMEKWIKSIKNFNDKMIVVYDEEVVKEALAAHIEELQEVVNEIGEWNFDQLSQKEKEALARELSPYIRKIKDKWFLTRYFASRTNALRFGFRNSAIKYDYEVFVLLADTIKNAVLYVEKRGKR